MARHIYIYPYIYIRLPRRRSCVWCVSVTVCLCIAARLSNEKAAGEKEDKVGPCQPHIHTHSNTGLRTHPFTGSMAE